MRSCPRPTLGPGGSADSPIYATAPRCSNLAFDRPSRPALRSSKRRTASLASAASILLLTLPHIAASQVFPADDHRGAPAMLDGGGHPRPEPRPGYLGVSLQDLDPSLASRLHIKSSRGVLILSVDGDAPAAAAGLRARDVILEFNGHRVEDADQVRHKLHETPAGVAITLRISRDGTEQTIPVQLGDQEEIARRAWEQHFHAADADDASEPTVAAAAPQPSTPPPAQPFVPPTGRGPGSSFLGVFSVNAFYTGAELDPLSTQLAEYFGVHDGAGLLVRSVNTNSPAASAGLKAGDVILRVNSQPVVSRVDWTRQLHANRGRAMQLSIMRNRREQTMTLTAGAPAKKG